MGKNKTVDIIVEPDSKSPNGYAFRMEQNGVTETSIIFDKNVDNMKKSEKYDIDFKLDNRKGADLVFSSLPDKVLWAKKISSAKDSCPDTACYMPGEFYLNPAVPLKEKQISVINPDMTKQLFAFALNFVPKGTVEGPSTNYICFDPIGDNRNGGIDGGFEGGMLSSLNSPLAVGALAVGVLAVAFLVLRAN